MRNFSSMPRLIGFCCLRLCLKCIKRERKIFIHAKDTLNGNKREKAEFFYDDNGCWLPLIFDNRHRLSFQSSSVFYFFFWCTTEFPSLCNLVIQCAVKKRVVTTLTSWIPLSSVWRQAEQKKFSFYFFRSIVSFNTAERKREWFFIFFLAFLQNARIVGIQEVNVNRWPYVATNV